MLNHVSCWRKRFHRACIQLFGGVKKTVHFALKVEKEWANLCTVVLSKKDSSGLLNVITRCKVYTLRVIKKPLQPCRARHSLCDLRQFNEWIQPIMLQFCAIRLSPDDYVCHLVHALDSRLALHFFLTLSNLKWRAQTTKSQARRHVTHPVVTNTRA